jgi:hypothetical protein
MDSLKAKAKSLTPKTYIVVACVVIVLLTALAGFFFWKYVSVKNDGASATANQEKSERIIGQVSEHFQLPSGEEPTVAEVQDKDKLDKQQFFDKAENGDYILIYKEAKLAFIYRESVDKLINVGPITLDSEPSGQAAGASTESQN